MAEIQQIQPEGPGLLYRIRPGIDPTQPLVILLHGWTGDEKVMWYFEKILPKTWWVAAFRGLYPALNGGFSWTADTPGDDPRLADFASSVSALMHTIVDIDTRFKLQRDCVVLMGFSQGAALAFSVPALTDWRPAAIVSLAGFMPRDTIFDGTGLPVFWGHGIRDNVVSIEIARDIVERLRSAGARVQYCEADVGHKAGLECAQGLKSWMTQTLTER